MRENRLLVSVSAVGLIILAAGLTAARWRLPEWRAGKIADRAAFASRYRAAAQGARIDVLGEPRTDLRSANIPEELADIDPGDPVYREYGTKAADFLTARGRGPYVDTTADARLAGTRETGRLNVVSSLTGEPLMIRWVPRNPFAARDQSSIRGWTQKESMIAVALPGAPAARTEDLEVYGARVSLLPVPASNPPESILFSALAGAAFAERLPGTVAELRAELLGVDLADLFIERIPELLVQALLFLGVLTLFMVLLVGRRIDLRHGMILALASMLFTIGEPWREIGNWYHFLTAGLFAAAHVIGIFALWSAAESWIRSTTPSFRTSLDDLSAGRIGPRSGRSLLLGWAGGAAVAGLTLMAMTAATLIPGVVPSDGSISLPLFRPSASPIGQGIIEAGLVLLAMAAAIRLPLIRRIRFAGVAIAALLLTTRVPVSNFWFAFVAAAIIGGALVFIYSRFGLTALLTATIVSLALPAAIYAALHASWLAGTLAVTSVLSAAPLAFGIVGIMRPEESEAGEVRLPAFVRRLESERRLQHEMDLLARMQLGLLPQKTPDISGYEIAAKSLLATEAGGDLYDFLIDEEDRLWLAAGDVSGHGYSCAIAQAMTKAGLASLVAANQTPAAVLGRLDRVLRTSGSTRTFTSLALLRLDSARGEGLLANAGHPFPMLAVRDEVTEIAIPSLPLGQGPARSYEDRDVRIGAGDVMVFFSDGLFEASNGSGMAYGFERLREILSASRRLPAQAILDRILEDWTRHLGQSSAADDTTIVVLKRTTANAP
jgi:phosphoserine phosphatase RsbU/P